MIFHKPKFLTTPLTMPASHNIDNNNNYNNNYNSGQRASTRSQLSTSFSFGNHRPVLRSRTKTFVDLSSRYSALPGSGSAPSSPSLSPSNSNSDTTTSTVIAPTSEAALYKREEAGLVTTAYAIRVTVVNNHNNNNNAPRREWMSASTAEDGAKLITANTRDCVRVVTIKKPYIVEKPLPLTPAQTPVECSMHSSRASVRPVLDGGASDGGLRVRSVLRESSGNKRPQPDVVELAGKIDLLDMQGNRVPFRHIYLPFSDMTEKSRQHKTMVVFVQPSSNYRQQPRREFLRALLSSLKTSVGNLPKRTNLVIIWCGSHARLRRLVESTQCPFPIYADPTGRVYQLLERKYAASCAESCRPSSSVPGGALNKLLARSSTRLMAGEGNAMRSDDAKHHFGAAFVFEGSEPSRVKVTWSYRLANPSARSEAEVIRRVLGGVVEEKQARLSKMSGRSSVTIGREKPLERGDLEDHQGFSCIYGLPKGGSSHRRTMSCTEGLQSWRPRALC